MRRKSTEMTASHSYLALVALLLGGIAVCLIASFVRESYLRTKYPVCYASSVEQYSTQYNIPPSLLYSVIRTESKFEPDAVSVAGAVGLVQMLPSTFRWLSDEMLGEHLPDGMLSDPETNIRYGACYLRLLYNRYQNWTTAIAAYNAGIGNVDTWLSDPTLCASEHTLNPEMIPFRETRQYVAAVTKAQTYYRTLYGWE